MDVQAELANAIKQRYSKMHGVPSIIQKTRENESIGRREETMVSEAEKASRRESRKVAAAALLAKMGNRQPPSSSIIATPEKSIVANGVAPRILPLNKEEEETAGRYRKMINIGLPEDAVRHKMVIDGVPERIVGAVMSGEDISPSRAPVQQKLPKETSDGSSSLSLEEKRIADKYRKMANIGVPQGAVLHKMIADGASQKIQDAYMAGEPTSATHTRALVNSYAVRNEITEKPMVTIESGRSALSVDEEKIAAKYRTMIKIKMPEGAVQHKMIADGVSTKIQDSVLGQETPQSAHVNNHSSSIESKRSSLSLEEEKIAAQYRTMIKIKIPEGAVRHKMIADGVPTKIQDSVLSEDVPGLISPTLSSKLSSCGSKTKSNISSLSREDETTATPYRKMMKIGMPEGVVKHKMTTDGISASIQKSVLQEEMPSDDSLNDNNGDTVFHMRPPANALTAAITLSDGMRSLKRAPIDEKKVTAAPLPSNPIAAAIVSTGGIKSLKRTTVDDKPPAMAPSPSNPLVAAIASSGGIRSLKKTPRIEKKSNVAAISSNPFVAALAGGIPSLKKKSIEKTKKTTAAVEPSNPLAVAIADPVRQGGLKNSSTNKENLQLKQINTKLLNEISSGDPRSGLKKNPGKSPEIATISSTFNPLGEELLSAGFQSALKKSSRKSLNQSPDVSTSACLIDESSSKGLSLEEDWPKDKANKDASPGHLSDDSVKSVRSQKGSLEGSNHDNKKDYSPSHLSGYEIKSVRSKVESPNVNPRYLSDIKMRSVRSPEEVLQMTTTETNQENSLTHLSDIKAKSGTESSGRNDITNKDASPKRLSGIKVRSTRLLEEPLVRRIDFANEHSTGFQPEDNESDISSTISSRSNDSLRKMKCPTKSLDELPLNSGMRNQIGGKVKLRRSHREHPKRNNSADSESKKSAFSFQSATTIEGGGSRSISSIQFRGTTALEESYGQKLKTNIKTRFSRTSDYSQRSRTSTKEPNSKVKNFQKRRSVVTTNDGVDHHCNCTMM